MAPVASADTLTKFADGKDTATLTFSGPGTRTAYVQLDDDATVTSAGMDLDGQEITFKAGYPSGVSLDVGGDGKIEWAFDGTGVGGLGNQGVLSNGSATGSARFTDQGGGADSALKVLLPRFAKVKDANLVLTGNGSAVQPGLGPILKGTMANENLGTTGSNVGDVNGDGWDDFIVCADSDTVAKAYLYFGGPIFDKTADLTITGAAKSNLGVSVAGLGDVNKDGIDDFAIGENGSLRVRVYFGGPGLDATADLNLTGQPAGWSFYGFAVAGGSDLDGDGINDIAVGDWFWDGNDHGRVYVYKGGPAMDNVSDYILEQGSFQTFGHALAMGGDVTGDGWDDLVVSDIDYLMYGWGAIGRIYVYKGGPGFGGASISTAYTSKKDDWFGWDVDIRNDVNGDGIDDVVVGAPDNGSGRVYYYWGRQNWPAQVNADWTTVGEKDGDFFGFSVATLGDLNGDSHSELLVGAPGWDNSPSSEAGKAYLFNGSSSPVQSEAYTIPGKSQYKYVGWWVEYMGDVANDGGNDFVVSAIGNNSGRGDVQLFHPTWGLAWPGITLGGVKALALTDPLLNKSVKVTFTAADVQKSVDTGTIAFTDAYGNRFVELPIGLSAESAGTMKVTNISINYSADTSGVMALEDAFNAYLDKNIAANSGNATGAKVKIPINVTSATAGKVVLSGLVVEYGANKAPVAVIDTAAPTTMESGDMLTLEGHGTDDGKVVDYNWSSDLEGALGSEQAFSVKLTEVGTHTISMMVRDDKGRWSAPATTVITVLPRNVAPSVWIDSPIEGQSVSKLVTIAGRASDPDIGNVVKIQVDIDGTGWRNATGVGAWSIEWNTTNETDGGHTITARAFDGRAYSAEAVVNVTVTHPVPGLDVVAPAAPEAYPGDGVTLVFIVANTGTDAADMSVQVSTNPYALVEMTTPTVHVLAGNSSTVKVIVYVDKTIKPPADIEVSLKVKVADRPLITDQATVRIKVVARPPNPAEQGVYVETPQDGSGKAGNTINYVFKVRNTGTVTDSYTLMATSSAGWKATLMLDGSPFTGPLNLEPGRTVDVTVALEIPKGAKPKFVDELTLKASSQTFPLVNASKTVRTTVLAQREKTTVITVPVVPIVLVTTAATLIAIAAIIGGTEWGKYGLFWMLIPLYSRLKKEAVLDNFKRGEINAFIKLNPGTYYNEIKKHLDISNGVLTYHLNRLEVEGYIKSKLNGRYKHYFPADMKIPDKLLTLNELQRALLNFIRDHGWVTQAEISEQLDMPVPTVSRHLKRLMEAGMVIVEKRGALNYYGLKGEWADQARRDGGWTDSLDARLAREQGAGYVPSSLAGYQASDSAYGYNTGSYVSNYPSGDYRPPDEKPPGYQQ